MVIKRFSNILGSRKGTNPFTRFAGGSSSVEARPDSGSNHEVEPPLTEGTDTPEGNVARGVRLFCESAGSGVSPLPSSDSLRAVLASFTTSALFQRLLINYTAGRRSLTPTNHC